MTLPHDEARAALHAERDQALARRRAAEERFTGDNGPPGLTVTGEHPGDAASELSDREVAEAVLEQADHDLREIDAALERLEDGSYGRCEVDAEPIDPDRLRTKPAARYCTVHQQEAEARA